MKKYLSCLFVLLALVLPMLCMEVGAAETVASGTCGNSLEWKLDGLGTLTITGTGPMENFAYRSNPWADYVNLIKFAVVEEGVVSIGDGAFENCGNLTDVTIPDSVTSIGNRAFDNCISLGGIAIPDNVTNIGGYAFSSCESLTSVTIPDGVTEIVFATFMGCSNLTSVTVPDSVTDIGGWAFLGCDSLISVTIPEGITTIYNATFAKCTSLVSVTIPDSVTRIEDNAFYGCSSLITVHYGGTETQRLAISSDYSNQFLLDAMWHYQCTGVSCKPGDSPFVDVRIEDYYYTPVLWAVSKGVTNGMDAIHFAPDGTCTRAQIVTFLWRAKGSPEPVSGYNPFRDLKINDYFFKAVLWAVENGITTGTSATTFSPDAGCTRGQVATFLWRSQGQPSANGENIFRDIASSAYYYDAVLWAVANGITNGMGEGIFAPDATCTRGQIVTFLCRAMAK